MSLRINTIVNYLGQGWVALMGLAFIPIYIRYLGIEAWGLVGVLSMMQAWLSLLDLGLTPTLSREMARFTAGAHTPQSIRDLLRSMEIIYGVVALSVILVVWVLADSLAGSWLKAGTIPNETVVNALVVMGLVLAARMVEQVYRGAIQGLQKYVWLNTIQSTLATVRWLGAVGVLAYGSATIEAFFAWQGFVSILTVLVFGIQTYRWLPPTERPGRFDLEELNRVKAFAGGMAITTLLALLLTQVDKLMLSKILPLDDFGYYVLAGSVASMLTFLSAPLSIAISPRFAEQIARSEQAKLVQTYHRASQWMAVILIPSALTLASFSESAVWAWSGDANLAKSVAPLLTLLALGAMFNGFMHIPYATQLAYGWTGFVIRLNMVAVVVVAPAILWAVPRFGGIGAAWVWLALNVGYVVVGMHFMHRRLLPAEKWIWYRRSIAQPLAVGAVTVLTLKLAIPLAQHRFIALICLGLVWLTATVLVLLFTPEPRALFVQWWILRKNAKRDHE